MVRSQSYTSSAVLMLPLCACTPLEVSAPQTQQEVPRAAYTVPHLTYCDEAQPPTPCPCDTGFTCIRVKADGTADDWQCQAIWAVDCAPRCLPVVHPTILCHGNNEVHGVWTGATPKWMAALVPSDCPEARGWAWRVWGVIPDTRSRTTLDTLVLSTWRHTTPDCASEAPSPDANLPGYFASSVDPVYLLMPPGYGGAVGEILTP